MNRSAKAVRCGKCDFWMRFQAAEVSAFDGSAWARRRSRSVSLGDHATGAIPALRSAAERLDGEWTAGEAGDEDA